MKTKIIRIGNSRGILLPKSILTQCKLGDMVELEVENSRLVIRSVTAPRAGWDQAQVWGCDPLARLKGSVLAYRAPTHPVAEDDWEAVQ